MVDLVCPRDRSALRTEGEAAACEQGHRYPIVQGVPVLLLTDEPPTHAACCVSGTRTAEEGRPAAVAAEAIDPMVQQAVAATCGSLYKHMIGRMTAYPIPEIRLPPGEGRLFLDVGCNWGRWCIAAARRGYRAVGIDPSLDAILAARRVAQQLRVDAQYVVGDARHLPFADESFDVAFSYSVFQHFARADAVDSFRELARVLRPGGRSLVQLANVWGARSLFNQARERRFREQKQLFDVRYWGPRELERELEREIGPTRLFVDGFFTLNPQPADLPLLPRRYRAVVRVSEALRKLSDRLPALRYAADSLYAESTR